MLCRNIKSFTSGWCSKKKAAKPVEVQAKEMKAVDNPFPDKLPDNLYVEAGPHASQQAVDALLKARIQIKTQKPMSSNASQAQAGELKRPSSPSYTHDVSPPAYFPGRSAEQSDPMHYKPVNLPNKPELSPASQVKADYQAGQTHESSESYLAA